MASFNARMLGHNAFAQQQPPMGVNPGMGGGAAFQPGMQPAMQPALQQADAMTAGYGYTMPGMNFSTVNPAYVDPISKQILAGNISIPQAQLALYSAPPVPINNPQNGQPQQQPPPPPGQQPPQGPQFNVPQPPPPTDTQLMPGASTMTNMLVAAAAGGFTAMKSGGNFMTGATGGAAGSLLGKGSDMKQGIMGFLGGAVTDIMKQGGFSNFMAGLRGEKDDDGEPVFNLNSLLGNGIGAAMGAILG